MSRRSRTAQHLLFATAVLLIAAFTSPHLADAGGKRRKAQKGYTYYFEVTSVKLAKGVPAHVVDLVRAEYTAAVKAHTRLIHELDPTAPDRVKQPVKFKAYLKKLRIKAFLVRVEVKDYAEEVEDLAAPRRGKRVGVRIGLHTFGETLPGRTIAFVGKGSATVKIDVGKRVRKRDSKVANKDSTAQAVLNALNESIRKLDLKPPVTKKRKRRRRKRRRKK